MKLTDKQLERLQLRPDRVAAIRERRAEINRRRDERMYSTPITDRLLDVGPMEDSTDDETYLHRSGVDSSPRIVPRRCDGHDGEQRTGDPQADADIQACGRRIFRRFLITLAYAALLTFVVWAVFNSDGGWRGQP